MTEEQSTGPLEESRQERAERLRGGSYSVPENTAELKKKLGRPGPWTAAEILVEKGLRNPSHQTEKVSAGPGQDSITQERAVADNQRAWDEMLGRKDTEETTKSTPVQEALFDTEEPIHPYRP